MFSGEIFENTPLGRQAWFSTDTSPQVLPPALSPSAPLPSLRQSNMTHKLYFPVLLSKRTISRGHNPLSGTLERGLDPRWENPGPGSSSASTLVLWFYASVSSSENWS